MLFIIKQIRAEGEGFEPPFRRYRKAVFKTAAFNHSAIPPGPCIIPEA